MDRQAKIAEALRRLAPRLPRHEFGAVMDHACNRPGLRGAAPEVAAWLSLVSYVRHVFTDYDALLAEGYDLESARFFVVEEINDVLMRWGVVRRIARGDETG